MRNVLQDSKVSSGLWKHGLLLTVILAYTALLGGGVFIFKGAAPIPERVIGPKGEILFTNREIRQGQADFLRYGLMDYGTILGNGAYLGPDFTAWTLHLITQEVQNYYAQQEYGKSFQRLTLEQQAGITAKTQQDLQENRYDPATRTLHFTPAQVFAWRKVQSYYQQFLLHGDEKWGLPKGTVKNPETARRMANFFTWTAWMSVARRPGLKVSYTANFPYDPVAGNTPSYSALLWSAVSVTLLLVMIAVVVFLFFRYRLWTEGEGDEKRVEKHHPYLEKITPSQRSLAKFFLVVSLLFLVQVFLGGLMAHYYAQGESFFGLPLHRLLPFNIARTWHLQLAIFWIALAWLGTGLFVAPLVGGNEPRRQKLLVNLLFGAVVFVALGSLAGEWLGSRGYLGNLWSVLGTQGFEYIQLGRLWQVLLVIGLGLWLGIVYRALRNRLQKEPDKGSLSHLLLYSSVAIPMMFTFAFFFGPKTHITVADYWRWWIIHLWVEGVFEVFAVVVIGFLTHYLGLVSYPSVLRATYFQLLLLLGSGVIGTGHHYYFIGAPEIWMALGSVFSALETIPLTLLIIEAYSQYQVTRYASFAHKDSFRFLVATAVWNLVGAGVLGFLINLPIVNYYEHGTFLTAVHGHAALMGVYGMLAIALSLFCLRFLVMPQGWDERLLRLSYWGLNLGLAGMLAVTLLPVGLIQLQQAFEQGYWSARTLDFYRIPLVHLLLWLRILPDSIFIGLGVLPLVLFMIKALRWLRPIIPDKPSEAPREPELVTLGR